MKMSDTICVPKSEPGFLTNCRLCLNESKFQTVSVFDEKYKNDDLARKIMLLTNIVITPPLSSHSDSDADPPSSICIKCKNKVDAFLAWKETAWSLQKQFKPTPAPDSSAHHHHNHYRHSRHQGAKSEKLPLRGHRSSNDSCIDEDYDSLLASPCSSGPDGGSSMEEEGPHHHLMMEPVVKIEEESVEYNSAPHGDYGGGEGDPDSTELVIDENRLRHEQSRIQHFLNRGGANSILRSLISAELPIIRPPCSSEGAVLTNRTNLPISPALPPFKLDDSSKHGTPAAPAPAAVAPYRRKQRNPTRTHEGEDQAQEEGSGCALRALPDEVLSQKLPVPSSSSSSSSSSGGGHPASVIMHPSSSSSSSPPQHPHHASPKKARKSMYPFNYLLEAIDFTSRQSSPENTSDLVLGATSVIATTSPAPTPPPSCDEREMQSPPQQQDTPMEEEPTPEVEALYHEEDEEEEEEEEEGNKDPEALEKMRRDLQELQRQQQKQREQDQLIIQQHLRETIAGVASRTQDPGDHETNHHDYSSPRAHPPPVFSIKLNTNHIPSSLSNGYYQGPDLKSAAEISLKNLLASHQAPGPPAILKKARAPRTSHYGAAGGNHNSSSPSYGNHGNMNATGALSLKMTSSLSGPDSPSPSPSPSPLCMSPSPSPLPLPLPSNTSEAESPRGSPKIRFTSSQSPYPNLQIGQILPKRHDLACSNCNTKVTTIWRRYPSGEMVCNACGLYYRLHCRPRPVSMRRDNIHPRKRRPKTSGGGGAGASGGKRHSSHMLSNVDSGDKESLSSGDESSSISLNSFISTAPFHAMAPFPGSPLHHYAHGALNLSPLQCEDNLPLNLAAQPTAELAR